ncbi:MAG: enoyl-CoA hydratase/isomerase family protein [Rhodospirillales bacterium]|nr:enoyl-CoA hydratase/isomerase family protein [Rhodospirillales bacterium]
MADDTVLVGFEGAVATVTLNRPKAHNAFDDALVALLTSTLEGLGARYDVRVVVLTGHGKSFSAGADLAYMKRAAGFSEAENIVDARAVARLLMVLGGLPKPTVALVQGPAYGGGVGLVSACDIAIAADSAAFALTEVRLGLIPAVISPFVVRAIGDSWSRRYMLTGERFDAETALHIGLVHEVVPAKTLEARGAEIVQTLLRCSPDAQRRAKSLIDVVSGRPIDDALADDVARRIADARASEDGKEGIAAFLEKRPPKWWD